MAQLFKNLKIKQYTVELFHRYATIIKVVKDEVKYEVKCEFQEMLHHLLSDPQAFDV